MKFKFYSIFLTLSGLCFFIVPRFATSQMIADTSIWRSSVNTKPQQITISGKDKLFTINLFISPKKQSILQISYQENNDTLQDIRSLNFTLGKQVFILKKQIKDIRNQAKFGTSLETSQVQILIQNLSTQNKAYITQDREYIAFSLKGCNSIISSLLQYLDKNPMPELQVFFDKVNSPTLTSWLNLSLQENKLLYGMGLIVFLLLFGRHLFKCIAYFYKKRRNRYRLNKAYKIATDQIEQNASILYIKRDQLLYKDAYGSLIEDKWIQEVNRFIRTKIKPILTENHLLEYYPQIHKNTIKKILSVAKYPPRTQKTFFKNYKKTKIEYSPTMDPFDYEAYCAELLRLKGWDADVTTASGDQGADVIAVKNGITFIIQCKLYSKPVGNKAVQEVNAAKIFYHAHYAAVVSNAAYTISARQLAASTEVTLLHHETLQKFAQTLT
ncbi:Endonuclease [Commensalibacter papalotli (ex Botero et al. 2024)]|nr:Endonuclease [Commensalibacter papalotli (ex Botero et al. 2024)]